MEGNLGFGEGISAKKKDINEKFLICQSGSTGFRTKLTKLTKLKN